jgi:DNA-binding NarL/FixJ family response regulator
MPSCNIIIVDDHPFIIEGYKNAIRSYSSQYEFTVEQANNCKSAYDIITTAAQPFDVALFDISMPPYEEKNIFSGEDLAKLVKEVMPDCKVVLLTMHTELIKINNMIKNIDLAGLIIKNDLTFDELLVAFDKILKGEKYYSQTVVKFVNQDNGNSINVDAFDKQILYQLSKGVKTKDIPTYVPLSLSAVEKRKLHLKEVLDVKGGTDADLVKKAKDKGLL